MEPKISKTKRAFSAHVLIAVTFLQNHFLQRRGKHRQQGSTKLLNKLATRFTYNAIYKPQTTSKSRGPHHNGKL